MAGAAIIRIAVDQIDVPADRLRALKGEQAFAIGQAILADRQYDAIAVTQLPGKQRFLLVDGLHRLEGCRMAGIEMIEARLVPSDRESRRRQEVLSAWARADHDAFDKAAQVAAMADMAQLPAFAEDEETASAMIALAAGWDEAACEALGISRRSLFNYLKLHRFYTAEQKAILRAAQLAGELVPLIRLAALPPEDFETAFNAIAAAEVASIAEALALVAPGLAIDPVAKKNAAFLGHFAKRTNRERADFMRQLADAYHPDGRPKAGGR
jgi:ParB-like chromosome segregation protein Spo0J